MKRKVSILLSGVLMLSLTACGGNQASAPETTEAAKAVAAAETTAEEKGIRRAHTLPWEKGSAETWK